VPELPTVDQLHNHGKPALPKWKKPKNLRIKHNWILGTNKIFSRIQKYVRALNKLTRQS